VVHPERFILPLFFCYVTGCIWTAEYQDIPVLRTSADRELYGPMSETQVVCDRTPRVLTIEDVSRNLGEGYAPTVESVVGESRGFTVGPYQTNNFPDSRVVGWAHVRGTKIHVVAGVVNLAADSGELFLATGIEAEVAAGTRVVALRVVALGRQVEGRIELYRVLVFTTRGPYQCVVSAARFTAPLDVSGECQGAGDYESASDVPVDASYDAVKGSLVLHDDQFASLTLVDSAFVTTSSLPSAMRLGVERISADGGSDILTELPIEGLEHTSMPPLGSYEFGAALFPGITSSSKGMPILAAVDWAGGERTPRIWIADGNPGTVYTPRRADEEWSISEDVRGSDGDFSFVAKTFLALQDGSNEFSPSGSEIEFGYVARREDRLLFGVPKGFGDRVDYRDLRVEGVTELAAAPILRRGNPAPALFGYVFGEQSNRIGVATWDLGNQITRLDVAVPFKDVHGLQVPRLFELSDSSRIHGVIGFVGLSDSRVAVGLIPVGGPANLEAIMCGSSM
jgi:hypothetical protein